MAPQLDSPRCPDVARTSENIEILSRACPLFPKELLRFMAGNGLCGPPYDRLRLTYFSLVVSMVGGSLRKPEEEGGGDCGD